MKYANNVKPGDIIVTKIGSAVLIRETRAKWFYLFRNRVNSISKSEFWRMVDVGEMEISYVDNKKYRRKQKKHRIFDIRNEDPEVNHLQRLEDFLDSLDPREFWMITNGWERGIRKDNDYFSQCINHLKVRGYKCNVEKSTPGNTYIRIVKNY